MISNSSSSYKHKASKNHDFDYNQSDDNYENNSVDDDLGETNHKYGRYRGGGRARSTEFRSSSRINDRRGGYRGRGGPSRRGDRDFSDNFYKKYELRNSDSVGNFRGKFYEPEKKIDFKYILPEDTRISKLLRRLSTENDQENSLAISQKLLQVLLLPDNAVYVRKAFHILGESMYEILYVAPGPLAKQQAARALGRMGYIMAQENDFERYQHWLFSKMSGSYEDIQVLLMKSFKETCAMEAKKPVLQNHIDNLINSLVLAIETTEIAEIFKAILDTLMTFVELYPAHFYDQFRDTTDLLFGWHVDHTQSLENIEFISKNLQKCSHHFKSNLSFSVLLIENFLEDIVNYACHIDEPDSNTLEHVTVLILALNTVLKCLDNTFHPANGNKYVTVEFVNKCIQKVLTTLSDFLDVCIPDNLIIAANECIGLLLVALETKSQSLTAMIFKLVDKELALLQKFCDASVVSMLLLISKVIKELSTNLPIELIEKLIGPESSVLKLRYSPMNNIQQSVICVYQALLNVKNVSLLQEAYRYVLGDLEIAYMKIVPTIEPVTQNNPFLERSMEEPENFELTVLFLLRCLSQLANASSIIVMWALKPTILELVGVNLQPYNRLLSQNAPSLQYSLLYLLYSHCKCYNHFISNSTLVTNKKEVTNMMNRFTLSDGLNINDVPNTSPNSGNFAIILDILYKTLSISTSSEVTYLLLQWLNDILINSENYLENLYNNEKFTQITDVLVKCGYNFNTRIVEVVCLNLEKLLSNKQLSWSNVFLTNVTDLCKLHMNSNVENLRECYTKLASYIPWDIAIVQLNKINCVYKKTKTINSKDYNNFMVYMAQNLHLNGNVESEMYPLQFKTFMNYLLKNEKYENNWLEDLFTCCWTVEGYQQMNMELFYDLTVSSRQVLNNWSTLEAAQFCVNYKLRTPLGKPNETFTKIEGALNQLGNDLISLKKNGKMDLLQTDSSRVRMLLQFIEHLEKSIYNASEGTAMAMLQPSKVVRSFFIANMNTCNEWLSRIRMVVMHIALHSGESNIALRHGQCLLKDMVNTGKLNSPDFEKVLIFVTISLLNLKETEALYGLYFWCKNVTGKRMSWIKFAGEQAAKRYEIALEGYNKVISSTSEETAQKGKSEVKVLEPDTLNFIKDQIVVCFKELNNWTDLITWYDEKIPSDNVENGRKYSFNTTDWECNKCLAKLDFNNLAFDEMTTWEYKENKENWSVYESLSMVETNLYNLAINITKNVDETSIRIEDNISIIQRCIQDHLSSAPSEFLQTYSLLLYAANGLKNVANNANANTVFLVSENFENEIEKIDSSVLRKILWWTEYFGAVQNHGFNAFCNNLRLDIVKRARKEKNFKLAYQNIHKFFWDQNIHLPETFGENVINLFFKTLRDLPKWSVEAANAVSELIKLSYIDEQHRNATFNLCAVASTEISKYAEVYGGMELRKISSKILNKLAQWLQVNDNISITEMNSPLGKFIMVLPEIGMMENFAVNIIPMNEMAIGKLLQFSVHHCASLAKSWNSFGTWCYRWGKKIVDQSIDITNNLSEEICLDIKRMLPPDTSEEDTTQIVLILSQTRAIIDDEDIGSNEYNTSEMIQSQLKGVGVLRNAPEELLNNLVQIWKCMQKRIYTYYALSADAYFKYLHLATNSENVTKSTECMTITVTLRLLRLIVKYALELQNILEEGLETTPTKPWKVIIPQLFSRLNHPEAYVRHRVSDLLCRVAEDAPQLITFPAVVGALEGGVKFDFSEITLPKDCLSQINEGNDDELNEEEDYDSDNEEPTNTLQICFKTMVDTLSKQDPETIAQVQLLVKELRRITLLWDELWLGTLAQHQTEISKRQQQLEYEIEKVNENPNLNSEEKISLIAEKHRIIIKPIIFILEQLQDVTCIEPETPHEKEFQEKYVDDIKDVILKLKNPESPEKPQESLQPLKLLQKKFQQKFHKRTAYNLKMQDISPVLHGIKDTVIAMPGIASTSKNVTISHVSNLVSILPTKTKPKKLIFYGSDGQTYTYLFKGLEDLHLDERIMQFLSIANTMMAQNADPSGHNLYRARHYSVIPLGPRSGLISWVDGTTPVFALYKRWQQRETVKPNPKNTLNTSTSILRPSELFYNKLNPLLQEHGVKNIDNRKEWPLSILKQVLKELMTETPSDLLAKELWSCSISAGAWWQVVKRYSYSVAVMSIIGYIIGLGDRHLDNVLVDLTTGDVVHIDYNVCFEKGKTLRVPEKVPFRLTPNIRDALGVTGVEGIFRLACENVLKTMRKGRETLLTLLEAFVYDPLIDWTVGGEVLAGTTFGGVTTTTHSRQSKKDLEREVTLSMFNVRCTEMRVEWNDNKLELLTEVPKLENCINDWLAIDTIVTDTDDLLQDLHQQLALVKEAEAHGANKHPLYKLPLKYDTYHKTQNAMLAARKEMEAIIIDCETHLKVYHESLQLFENEKLNNLIADISIGNTKNMHIFDLVREFLHNAGKDDVIVQCQQSESEVEDLSQNLNICIKKCLQYFQDYYAILSTCPKSYLENHRLKLFHTWAKLIIESKSVNTCETVFENFKILLDNNLSPNVINFAFGLDNLYKDTVSQVNKLFEELTKINTKEPTAALEKIYNNSKISINTFLGCEKGAKSAYEFIIASELITLNKSFLILEKAAHRSDKVLIKLQTRDGDWFLDDLVLNSLRAVELINSLPKNLIGNDVNMLRAIGGVKLAHGIYRGLSDLHSNFHTIILPESMKKIQSEEETVLQLITDINDLISGINMSIPDLIEQLNKILKTILMQMDVNKSYDFILEKVATIRNKFHLLIGSQTDNLTQGKMLLMGFNGLFEKLNKEMIQLISTLSELDIPTSWKKIDQVKEAKSISAHIFNPDVMKILDDIFLLKRLQTISEFFQICQDMCQSFKKNANLIVLNDEQLVKPVRQFIADYISAQLLGVTPETIAYLTCYILQNLDIDLAHEIEQKDVGAEHKVPIDELYHKSYNVLLKNGVFTQNVLSQASSLQNNLKNSWEKIRIPKKLEQKLAHLQSSALRLQNQLMVHSFMYDELHGGSIRNKLMNDCHKELLALQAILAKLNEAREKQQALIDKAHQRLNWAKGANPNVGEISAAFESAVAKRDAHLNMEQSTASTLWTHGNSILQYEILRNNSVESNTYNTLFTNSLEKWKLACQFNNSKIEHLSHTEESIMNLLTADLVSDNKWVQTISEIITQMISIEQKKLSDAKTNCFSERQNLQILIDNFKSVYNVQSKLMSDVKNLIKTMTKIEDYSLQTQQFVVEYRQFVEHFNMFFGLFKKDMQKEEFKEALTHIKYIKEHTDDMYEKLLELEVKKGRPSLVRQDCVILQPQKQDSTTKGQQRNAYAVGVWRRVKMKLEGRDPDPGRKYTAQEQVDYVIREATSLDNLALLYEGWTPWV